MPGYTGHLAYTSSHHIGKCGFAKMGNLDWCDFGSYEIDTSREWAFCEMAEQLVVISRISPEHPQGQVIEYIKDEITVDPKAFGKPLGWCTSGDQEVIKTTDFNNGVGSALVFGNPNDAPSVVR
jgi:hypothetical protein